MSVEQTHEEGRAVSVGSSDLLGGLEAVKLLKGCAYELWGASLCAGPQHIRDLFEELRNPQVGDLVMETTTHRMPKRDPLEGIGRLVSITHEPMYTPEAWRDGGGEGEPIPRETIYTIALVFDDGRLFRWRNAMFIKVKTERGSPNTEHQGTPQ